MQKNILSSIRLTLVCIVLFCGIYTSIIWLIAQALPNNGNGEIVTANGKKYYANIGQSFTQDNYFNSRPSAVNYNAACSGGSNKGPSNAEYLAQVQTRIDTFIIHNPTVKKIDIPSELVTASGSGLDPDISPNAAIIQVNRIAKIRNISSEQIVQLVHQNTKHPLLGLFGTSTVNVLALNIALDKL